jgi:hypothetical protein
MTIHQPGIALLAALLLSTTTLAEPPKKSPAKAPAKAKTSAKPAISGKLLIDAWYTITLNAGGIGGPIRYGYYNDHLESRDGKLYFQNRVWKLEQGFVNEEQLGAMAQDDPELTPLLYNFHSNYRANETMIDGTVKNGNDLTIRVRKGKEEMPVFRRHLPSKTILEVFFPVWLGRRIASFQAGKSISFSTLLEDSIDTKFETLIGRVKVEQPDAYATETRTTKVSVDFKGVKTIWWVDSSGVARKIENPGIGQIVEKVDREKAEAFLSGAAQPPVEPPDAPEETN